MRVAKFLQTPFISYDDKNMLYIGVGDWDLCNPYRVQLIVDGEPVCSQRIYAEEFSVLIPCCKQECVCTVRVTPFEDLPIEQEFTLHPPKHWNIPILYSSHEDLGYCAYIDKLHYESYEYLKKAMDLCVEHDGFRYMIEHYWWLDAFDCYASEEEKLLLKQLMKDKKIELNAIHSGVHTSWANSEQLVRGMYFSCIEAKQKYGVTPMCALYTDISGASMATVNAYTKMGIKYMAAFANGFRNSSEKKDFSPIFWWEDSTGESRVLFWYQRSYRPIGLNGIWCDTKRQYPEGEFFFDTTKALKTEKWFTEKINRLEPCNYDILPISFYDDREEPTTMLLTVCEEMNKKWKYPKFRMEIPSEFMSELEEKYGNTLPVFKGDIADQWADFATIAPRLTSKKRAAARKFYDAELLSVVSGINDGSLYESKRFDAAIEKMCEFDEHCWATSSKHPQKMHRYNIEKVKEEPIKSAFSDMQDIINKLCGQPGGSRISVINTIPQKRESYIRTDKNTPVPKAASHQILPDSTVITNTIGFDGAEIKTFDAVLPYSQSVEIQQDFIETPFYKVQFNKETQKITGITDKESGREILDTNARFELGQFIYLHTENKLKPESSFEIPKKIDFKIYEGDVAYVVVQKGYEEQSGAEVTAQFVFYKKQKNIDIDLSYKNAAGLIGDFYDRYKKNYFFAFPFKLDNPDFYTELPAGEKNEKTDIIPLNANDFTVTQNWVTAENENFGIALYSRDMPVFHVGKIKYNRFESGFDEDKAHYYLYASSNRCNNLIYTSIDSCHASYHLSVLPYCGKHNSIVPVWSNQKEHSLLIGQAVCKNEWRIKISESNIRLTALKKAEDCDNAVIMRFIETEGKAAKSRLELFFSPSRVMYATNDERDIKPVEFEDNSVSFRSLPYSYTTLKIYGDFKIKKCDG